MEYAASVGLVMDPWQQFVLEGALGEVGRHWAAFEVCAVVSRQNGKGGILEARELSGIELFGEKLIMHTAHELKTAEEARMRMEQICEASPDLDRRVKRVVRTNGKESIEFWNSRRTGVGARIKYIARSKGSGRGFSEAGLIVLDEAMILSAESMAALIPTMSTAENPQLWYMGSAGFPESSQLRALRQRAVAGGDASLAYFEWSAPDDADLDDPQAWALANPALGIRITEDFIRKEREAFERVEDWARERLGIWDDPKGASALDTTRWQALADPDSQAVGRMALGADVTPDRSSASIWAAGRRSDGAWHVEGVDPRVPPGKLVERLAEFVECDRPTGVAIDPAGPIGSYIPALEATGLELLGDKLITVSTRELGQACGVAFDAVMKDDGDTLRHLDDPALNAAVAAARKRDLGEAGLFAWARKDASDIAPLVAMTLAMHAYAVSPPTESKYESEGLMSL